MLQFRYDDPLGGQKRVCKEFSPPLTNRVSDNSPPVVFGLDRASFNQGKNAQFDFSVLKEEQPTITAKGPGAVAENSRSVMSDRLQGHRQSICESTESDNRGGANG